MLDASCWMLANLDGGNLSSIEQLASSILFSAPLQPLCGRFGSVYDQRTRSARP
jgi:hypothetical protein